MGRSARTAASLGQASTYAASVSDLVAQLAGHLRRERLAMGWSQQRLAAALGISQSLESRYETNHAHRPRVDIYGRAFAILGLSVHVETVRKGEPRPHDRAHAFMAAYVLRRLPRHWLHAAEIEVVQGGQRGWIDILAYDPVSRVLLVIEVKTEISDAGEIIRRSRWYAGQARLVAQARGWRPTAIVPVLLALWTEQVSRRLIEGRELFTSAFPGTPDALLELMGRGNHETLAVELPGAPAMATGYLALVDPISKRSAWLQAAMSGGGRRRVPYSNYADFVRAIEGRRIRRKRGGGRATPIPDRAILPT